MYVSFDFIPEWIISSLARGFCPPKSANNHNFKIF